MDGFVFLIPRTEKIEKEEKSEQKKGKPWPPKKLQHNDSYEDELWRNEGVYNQISRTHEKIKKMALRDEQLAYYVIETENGLDHPSSKGIIDRFNAKILCYNDVSRNSVLVEAPLNKLKEIADGKHLRTVESNIHLIRPLKLEEKLGLLIEEDTDWTNSNRRILIEIMPNIEEEKRVRYLSQLRQYLSEMGLNTIDSPSKNYLNLNGLLISTASINQAKNIAENSNIVFKIFKTPKIKQTSGKTKNFPRNNANIGVQAMSLEAIDGLYRVCVVDTGIASIPQLSGLIESSTFESMFGDGLDLDNHGTPISCLVTYGEGRNPSKPMFKILSHRIFSRSLNRGDLFNGLVNAIILNKNKTNVFVSSCVFNDYSVQTEELTARLNKFIQEQNVCVIFSGGNIFAPYDPSGYPLYLKNHKVYHPSDAPSITAVGGIVKRTNTRTFAPLNGPAPFNCTGCPSDDSVHKPEVVQHGGNAEPDGSFSGIGIQTYSNTGAPFEESGTSYASPLFGRIIGKVYSRYGRRFRNCETAKAIAFSSCNTNKCCYPEYLGFGASEFDQAIETSWKSARIVFEGNLPLRYVKDEKEFDVHDEITFNAPTGVSQVWLTIVHTDNYSRYLGKPKLNTYLYVKTRKPGNETYVNPTSAYPDRKITHAKKLCWEFSRGTVGPWKFEIHPKPIDIPMDERKDVSIRYGATIELISRKTEVEGLTQRFRQANGYSLT